MARLSVNINDEMAAVLRALAAEGDTSVTEVIRRCVSVYKFFHDETAAGKTIQLVDHKRNVETVRLV